MKPLTHIGRSMGVALTVGSVAFAPLAFADAREKSTSEAETALEERTQFRVLRNGRPFGTHTVTFAERNGELTVNIEIDLRVRFGPFVLFNYSHQNEEKWQGNELASLRSVTNNNGEDLVVTIDRQGDDLDVDGKNFEGLASGQCVPTSYWNPQTIEATCLINTQTGRVMSVDVEPLGPENLIMNGTTISAQKYQVDGDLTITLWYDDNNNWVKSAFSLDNNDVEYELVDAPEGDLMLAWFMPR